MCLEIQAPCFFYDLDFDMSIFVLFTSIFLQIHRYTCILSRVLFFIMFADVNPNLILDHLETILQDHS